MNKKLMFSRKPALCLSLLLVILLIVPEFSVRAENTVSVSTDEEFRGVWIAYSDFEKSAGYDREEFTDYVGEMFDNVAAMGMNAVMVHVRPFSDAMYKSKYYPWSYYASGKQGKNPGYDPLTIMVLEAHKRGIEIHAWLNPYRVSLSWNGGTDAKKLSKDNPARKWLTNKKTSDDRNVLAYQGGLYYNPSKAEVRTLIVNGVKEIVENYDVDGIHLDDYFYPDLGSDYEKNFDAKEYKAYKKECKAAGKKAKDIVTWRKANVNTLVKRIYAAVKKINPDCDFGISPGGYIDYFDEPQRWYVDYRTWMSKDGYVDYICPQLYWSFNTLNIYPFAEVMGKWSAALKNTNVRLYAGIPAYKIGTKVKVSGTDYIDTEFFNPYIMGEMVECGRRDSNVSGFIFFDYCDMIDSRNTNAVDFLVKTW